MRTNDLPGMEGLSTALGTACEDFIEQRTRVEDAKTVLEQIGGRVIDCMREEGRRELSIKVEGSVWVFQLAESEEKLKCARKQKRAA